MTDLAFPGSIEPGVKRPNLDKGFNPLTMILFGGILAGGRFGARGVLRDAHPSQESQL